MKLASLVAAVVASQAGAAYAASARVVELNGVGLEVPAAWTETESDRNGMWRTFNCPERDCTLKLMAVPGSPPRSADRRARHAELHRDLEAEIRKGGATVQADELDVSGTVGSSRMSAEMSHGIVADVRTLSLIDDDGRLWAWSATCGHLGSHAKACAEILDSMSILPGRQGGSKRPAEMSDEQSMAARIGTMTFYAVLALAAIAIARRLLRRR
jgi:hypothetical protein